MAGAHDTADEAADKGGAGHDPSTMAVMMVPAMMPFVVMMHGGRAGGMVPSAMDRPSKCRTCKSEAGESGHNDFVGLVHITPSLSVFHAEALDLVSRLQ